MKNGVLQEITVADIRECSPEVVLLAVGSTEPHGPALPYGTDFYACDALARRATELANERGAKVLMYPTLPIGNNVNFKAYPFAARIGVRTLMLVLLDIIQALEEDGIRKIAILNGHGGNTDAIDATLREHYDRTVMESRAFVCSCDGMAGPEVAGLIEHASPHGGESEICRMMHLKPELVRRDRLADMPIVQPLPIRNLEKTYFVRPWHLHLPESGGGAVGGSSAEKGARMFESGASGLADFLVSLSQTPWQPGFPFSTDE